MLVIFAQLYVNHLSTTIDVSFVENFIFCAVQIEEKGTLIQIGLTWCIEIAMKAAKSWKDIMEKHFLGK